MKSGPKMHQNMRTHKVSLKYVVYCLEQCCYRLWVVGVKFEDTFILGNLYFFDVFLPVHHCGSLYSKPSVPRVQWIASLGAISRHCTVIDRSRRLINRFGCASSIGLPHIRCVPPSFFRLPATLWDPAAHLAPGTKLHGFVTNDLKFMTCLPEPDHMPDPCRLKKYKTIIIHTTICYHTQKN